MKLGETTTVAAAGSSQRLYFIGHRSASGVYPGRIIRKFGPESTGKTHLALHIIAEAQKKGESPAYIDGRTCSDPVLSGTLASQYRRHAHFPTHNRQQALRISSFSEVELWTIVVE